MGNDIKYNSQNNLLVDEDDDDVKNDELIANVKSLSTSTATNQNDATANAAAAAAADNDEISSGEFPEEINLTSTVNDTPPSSSSGSTHTTPEKSKKSQDEKISQEIIKYIQSIKSMDDLLMKYNDLLDTSPVMTKAISSAIISAFGAALGSLLSSSSGNSASDRKMRNLHHQQKQQHMQKKTRIDWLDVFAFGLHGLFNGTISHYWFDFLAKQNYSTSKSMLIDQLAVQPPLLLFMFLFLDMTKASMRAIGPSLSKNIQTITPTLINSWKFWPLAVYCTFRYLKKKYYTLSLNLCSLAWTIYLTKGQGGGSK